MSFEFDDNNPSVVYSKPASGHHWSFQNSNANEAYNSTLMLTNHQGSKATLTFTGSGVTVYGLVSKSGTGTADPAGSFSIDSGSATEQTYKRTNVKQTRVPLFSSGSLPNGQHTIVVTALVEGAFFWLDSFAVAANTAVADAGPLVTPVEQVTSVKTTVVEVRTTVVESVVTAVGTTSTALQTQRETITSEKTVVQTYEPSPAQSSSSSSSSVSDSKDTFPIGAVVGGVVGGFFLILCAVFIFLWWRRSQRKITALKAVNETQIDPPPVVPFPPPPATTGAPSEYEISSYYQSSPSTDYNVPPNTAPAHLTMGQLSSDAIGKRQLAAVYAQQAGGGYLDQHGQSASSDGTSPTASHLGTSEACRSPGGFEDHPPAYPGVQTPEGNRMIANLQTSEKI